ncbi:MAG: competence/damage-inducible protein A, partial [Pseudomonadota bacterium]
MMHNQPKIGLIIIGDEILSGKRQDKHLAQANALLHP